MRTNARWNLVTVESEWQQPFLKPTEIDLKLSNVGKQKSTISNFTINGWYVYHSQMADYRLSIIDIVNHSPFTATIFFHIVNGKWGIIY